MKTYKTNRIAVRRFLLDSQHLLPPTKNTANRATLAGTMKLIRELECVQLDAVASVERNQHLVLAARMPGYQPDMLNKLLSQGSLFEYWANAACTIPMEDYPMFALTRSRFRRHHQEKLDELESIVHSVLVRLQEEGPLPSRAFLSTKRVHGGWDNKLPKTKATSHALNLLLDTDMIRVVKREGNERFFHLTEKTIPSALQQTAEKMDITASSNALLEKYMRAYRVFDFSDARLGWQKLNAKERQMKMMERVETAEVIPLEMEKIRRPYFILAEDLDRLQDHERRIRNEQLSTETAPIRILPPLDNLLWRRDRLVDLFDFHYKWEIYTPKEKRRYGYYAMPILAGDQLIGRMDPGLNRTSNLLTVRLLQLEPWVKKTSRFRKNMKQALENFAEFHQAKDIIIEKTDPPVRIGYHA